MEEHIMKKFNVSVLSTGMVCNRFSRGKLSLSLTTHTNPGRKAMSWETQQILLRALITLLMILHQLIAMLGKNPYLIAALLIWVLWMIRWLLKQILRQSTTLA
jgi:prepilin signal peptidase PulO-like enzyme (type II secretory pathway)